MTDSLYGYNMPDNIPDNTPPAKPRPKRILALILGVALVISLAANIVLLLDKEDTTEDAKEKTSNKIEGNGFSSPEKAIEAYVEALREGDMEKMISTFAIDSYVSCFDFEAYLEKHLVLQPSAIGTFLPDGGTYRPQLNTYSRLACVCMDIRYGYFELIGFDPINSPHMSVSGFVKEDEIEALAEELSAHNFEKNLSQIKTGDILTEDDFDVNEESLEYMLDTYSAYLDVDDFCDLAIEIEFDGEDYLFFMLTVKIDGRWYNLTTVSPLGRLKASENGNALWGGFLKQ